MNPYFRPTALDFLPSNINRLIICGEYGWHDVYHYLLHSCYAQPDASYWFQAAFELWRNTAMLVILTTGILFVFISMSFAANGAVWLISEGVKYAYNKLARKEPLKTDPAAVIKDVESNAAEPAAELVTEPTATATTN